MNFNGPDFWYISFLVFWVFFIVMLRRKNLKEQVELLKEQALKRNGSLQKSLFACPVLRIGYKGIELRVRYRPGTRRRPSETVAKARIALNQNGTLTIFRESSFDKLGKSLGMQDIHLNNAAFDSSYIVRAENTSWARDILSMDVQHKLTEIKELNPQLTYRNNRLRIKIKRTLRNTQEYDALIDMALSVIDRMLQLAR